MDIDFHFGTIYVLSRWAGFSGCHSLIIATASQFVDDNYGADSVSRNLAGQSICHADIRDSGYSLWGTIDGEGDERVWIPYHFLPGLEGKNEEQKLVCRKNSFLAKALAQRLSRISASNTDFPFELGVGLHVYADTWAHQEFSGTVDSVNNTVTRLLYNTCGSGFFDTVKNYIKGKIASKFPLGHAEALHIPDIPYVNWKSREKFTSGRNNWDEFMDASHKIFRILLMCRGNQAVDGLTAEQSGLLLDAFQTIQEKNHKIRNNEWIRRIRRNAFRFTDFSGEDRSLRYDKDLILHDADHPRQFYMALEDHYGWVRDELRQVRLDIL